MKKSSKTFKCSDPSKNIYGLTVRTEGIKMEGFNENPVCLYNHDYNVVLGAWTDYKFSGSDLVGVPMFDTENSTANNYYGQVERDVIKGASIGIIPLKVVGNEIVESELMEISITPVPANRNALVLYDTKGVRLSAKEAKVYLLSVQKQSEIEFKDKFMNANLLAALITLSANAGITLQLSASPTDEEVLGAITGIGNKLNALNLSNTQLKTANDAFTAKETAALAVEKTTLLNLAVSNKQITEAQREQWGNLYDANPELCKATLAGLPKVDLSVKIPGAEDNAKQENASAEKANWSFDDYANKAPLELSAMEFKNPAEYQKLVDAKVAAVIATGSVAQ